MSIKDIILRKIASAEPTVSYQEAIGSPEYGEFQEEQTIKDIIADKLVKPKRGQAVKILRELIARGGLHV